MTWEEVDHRSKMEELGRKLEQAKRKREEAEIKREIFLLKLPLSFEFKFSKIIVIFCITAIIAYTVAAILLQRTIAMELSPTLTTCVYAFFGSELIGMAGIKVFDSKYEVKSSALSKEDTSSEDVEEEEEEDTDSEAVG